MSRGGDPACYKLEGQVNFISWKVKSIEQLEPIALSKQIGGTA